MLSRRPLLTGLPALALPLSSREAVAQAPTRGSGPGATPPAAAQSGPTPAAPSPAQIAALQAIAEEAYTYGLPMLIGYKAMYSFNIDRAAGQFKAPFNQIANEARVFTAADTAISTPNSDTPYSILQLDLRAEPMVISIPEVPRTRYFDVQLIDLYTCNYGYLGSRTTGTAGGDFLVAGPDWQGTPPPGIRGVFRCETQFSLVIFRTQLFSPDEMDNVRAVQAGYRARPLSAFAGTAAPPPAPAIDWPRFEDDAFTSRFGEYLSFLLQFCPTTGSAAVEQPLRERFSRIGIGWPRRASAPPMPAAERAALGDAVRTAVARIRAQANSIGTDINGWRVGAAQGNRDFYNGNWTLRAAAALNGIYGNDAAEATYPFARHDATGAPLDGSLHTYAVTFPAGQLPPVNAFWSLTMYETETMLLVANPIDRYLINSPMLPGLKTNPDGSLTLYVQQASPGADKESNWLPAPAAPFTLVLRMYWPRTEAPSILPIGQGQWRPPAILPTGDLRAQKVTRFGDKSLETFIRTDDRYGHDGLFQGPRGWGYWNYLESPRPIQNPNLWPDMQSTYFLGRMALPAGSTMTLRGRFPNARYFQLAFYKEENDTFVSIGDALEGRGIAPDAVSTNPFRVGANRLAEPRDFTIRILAADPPANPAQRDGNTIYVGRGGETLQSVIRVYLSDRGSDGAGFGPDNTPSAIRGLPSYEAVLADGTRLDAPAVVARLARPIPGETKKPMTDAQWEQLVHAPDNDPALDPAASPARPVPKWEKYWNLRYSLLGAFKTAEAQGRIPFAGPMDAGGDPSTQYMLTFLSRKFGPVYVMRGRMPTFPDTYSGPGGRGAAVMPAAQTQYWSLVSCEAAPSGQIVDGICDMQIPLDAERNYTIVYSRREDRPANATAENGVAWIEWSPRGEGLGGPRNRRDFGMLMLRIVAPDPAWAQSPEKVTRPGTEEAVMGPYLPRGEYTTKAVFEARR